MEHIISESRDYVENDKGQLLKKLQKRLSHRFYKMDLLKVKKKGDRKGNIVGSHISTEIQVGNGPRQVSVERLKQLLEDGEPIWAPDDRNGPPIPGIGQRSGENRSNKRIEGPKLTIRLGSGPGEWKPKEIQEIIDTIEAEKPKRGRPKEKKSVGQTRSGNGSASSRATDSEDPES